MKNDILKALMYISASGPLDKEAGICRNVIDYIQKEFPGKYDNKKVDKEISKVLHSVFEGWKHNTGNYCFPIPGKQFKKDPKGGSYWDYRDTRSKAWKRPSKLYKFFFREMTYQELRYDLLEYSIQKLQKELEK